MQTKIIIRILPSVLKQLQEDLIYKVYIADTLQAITENTAKGVKDGKYMSSRFYDLINPLPAENRSAESIISDVVKNAGLVVIE